MHTIGKFPFVFLGALSLGLGVKTEDWPQWMGPNRDAVWRETGIIEKFPSRCPPVLWRTNIGAGYAGPCVANGRVYVADRQLATGVTNPTNPFQRGKIQG